MDISKYPNDVQKYLIEFTKRGVIDPDENEDKMLINYLYSQKYDGDYIDSLGNDRR